MTENKGDLISRSALKKAFALLMWREHNPYDTVKVSDIVNQTLDFIDNAPTVEPNKELIIKFEKEIEYLQDAQYDLDDEGGAVYSSIQREIEMYESIIKTLRGEKK